MPNCKLEAGGFHACLTVSNDMMRLRKETNSKLDLIWSIANWQARIGRGEIVGQRKSTFPLESDVSGHSHVAESASYRDNANQHSRYGKLHPKRA